MDFLDSEILALVEDLEENSTGAAASDPPRRHQSNTDQHQQTVKRRKRRRTSNVDSDSDGEYGKQGTDRNARRRNGAASESKSKAQDFDDSDEPAEYNPGYEFDEDVDNVDDGDASDPEWSEARTWSTTDLMGDADDRKRLMMLSELEREMLDALRERTILRRRLNLQSGLKRNSGDLRGQRERSERDRAGKKTFDTLRQKRESREKERLARTYDEDENGSDDGYKRSKAPSYSSHSEDEGTGSNLASSLPAAANIEDIRSIVVTRDELERWVHADFFSSTIIGCFVRIGVGNDPNTREQVYRLARVVETPAYHRVYRLAGTLTKIALKIAHGKATKTFLMDIVSNRPFTVSEWNRYEQTMQIEKQSMITADQVRRKKRDLQSAREHIFTNDEINTMIKRKKTLIKVPANITLEKLRIKQALQVAEEKGDQAQVDIYRDRIFELNQLGEEKSKKDTSHLEAFTKLNERNRKSNFTEGREAEKNLLELKKSKGTVAYDPFARRKTAPKHVVNRIDAKESDPTDNDATLETVPDKTDTTSNLTLISISRSSKTNPQKQLVQVSMYDDFLDSVDVAGLENELHVNP
ncbi:RNA polymerase-associated protein rtf1 [Batrachochytrium dendrobatidis]